MHSLFCNRFPSARLKSPVQLKFDGKSINSVYKKKTVNRQGDISFNYIYSYVQNYSANGAM